MKTKLFLFGALLMSLMCACSSDDLNNPVNSDPDSYFPLALNNSWNYKTPDMIKDPIAKITLSVEGTKTINGLEFFCLTNDVDSDTLFLRKNENGSVTIPVDEQYLRINAETGAILSRADSLETVILPAVIEAGMGWSSPNGVDSFYVAYTNAIVNAYTDLVQIWKYTKGDTNPDNILEENYYKKGVGCIQFSEKSWTLNSSYLN